MLDIECMARALELGQEALNEGEFPVGAVAVVHGEIIAEGRRSREGDTRLDHGEMVLLREVSVRYPKIPPGMIIYSTLEPCMQCMGAMLNVRAEHVYYALEDPYGGACTFLNFAGDLLPPRHQAQRMTSEGGLLREGALKLFRQFFATTQNPYWTSHPENPLYRLVMGEGG